MTGQKKNRTVLCGETVGTDRQLLCVLRRPSWNSGKHTHTKKGGEPCDCDGLTEYSNACVPFVSTHETNTHTQEAFSAVSCCVCMGCSYYAILRSIDATYTQYRLVLLSCCSVSFMCTKQRGLGSQRKISCPPLCTPPFSKKTICSRLSIQQFLF